MGGTLKCRREKEEEPMSSKMEGRISFRSAKPIRWITGALLRVVEDGLWLKGIYNLNQWVASLMTVSR